MMKIAFVHNVQTEATEAQAEFDSPSTVAAIVDGLSKAGHDVVAVDAAVGVTQLASTLSAVAPDLIFNTAEGLHGRARSAFYPALFEQLGIPFTGSDAHTCLVTLDKALSRSTAKTAGIRVPEGVFLTKNSTTDWSTITGPWIVKPAFEGSSKGIDQESVVHTAEARDSRIEVMLERYPDGLIVEQFIDGIDVAVPFVDGVGVGANGLLAAVEYDYPREGRVAIYDYALKNTHPERVNVICPARVSSETAKVLQEWSARLISAFTLRDIASIDWRVAPNGDVFFLEVNASPSLELRAGIYKAAALSGLKATDEVLDTIVKNCATRYGLKEGPQTKRKIRVGLFFNVKRIKPLIDGENDDDAEYDAPSTIAAIQGAIESLGHEVVLLEARADILRKVEDANIDVAFNVSEGLTGRTREAVVPAILDMLGIPFTGSDAVTMALTLDKALAKRVVRDAGVPTPRSVVLFTGKEKLPAGITYPVMVKPVAEGSSKGVLDSGVAENEAELRQKAVAMIEKYKQPALVETYLSGREFTIGLLGGPRPRALPPMEIVFKPGVKNPVYSFAHKQEAGLVSYQVPAILDAKLAKEINNVCRLSFEALGCRDVARIDVRCDGDGVVNFIECNPLPGLTPGWSDLCLISDAAGITYEELIKQILSPALRRWKNQRRAPHVAQKQKART
jgi:D-alanine-D-alanine ligase